MDTQLSQANMSAWPPTYIENYSHYSIPEMSSLPIQIVNEISNVESPGLFSPPNLFIKWIQSIKYCFTAIKKWDTETLIEHVLQVLHIPFGVAAAIEKTLVLAYLFFTGIVLVSVSTTATCFGFVFMAIELILELHRLLRSLQFQSDHKIDFIKNLLKNLALPNIQESYSLINLINFVIDNKNEFSEKNAMEVLTLCEKLLKEPNSKEDYHKLQELTHDMIVPHLTNAYEKLRAEFLTLTDAEYKSLLKKAHYNLTVYADLTRGQIEKKLNALSRRVRSQTSKAMFEEIPMALYCLKNGDKEAQRVAIKKAAPIFIRADTTAKKITAIHIIGMTAILLGVLSMIASIILCPPAIPLIATAFAIVFQLIRSNAPKMYLDEEGYTKINWKAPIPSFLLRKKLDHKQSEEKINLSFGMEMTSFVKA